MDRGGWLICESPGGGTQAIPTWMTDAALCAAFSAGPPEVSATALVELLPFLRDLNSSVKADAQLEVRPSREHLDEATEPMKRQLSLCLGPEPSTCGISVGLALQQEEEVESVMADLLLAVAINAGIYGGGDDDE